MLFEVGLSVLISIVIYLAITRRKFILIVYQTFPRDIRIVTRFIRLQLKLRWLFFRNVTFLSIFESKAKKQPNKPCFYFGDEIWTFAQVDHFANQIGNYFQQKGYEKGDHVALFMENRVEYIGIWVGLSKIGVVTALINTNLRHQALQHSIELSKAKSIVYGYELQDAIKDISTQPGIQDMKLLCFAASDKSTLDQGLDLSLELRKVPTSKPITGTQPSVNDTVLYIYTSGTTGFPKAAVIRHSRILVIGFAGTIINGSESTDTVYVPLPLYHQLAGVMGVGHALISGIPVVLAKKFSASRFWKDCIRYNVTVCQYMGEIMRYLLNQPPSLEDRMHKVRMMFGVGLRPEIWPEFLKRFNNPRIVESYGASEGNAFLVNIDGLVGAVGYMPIWLNRMMPQTLVLIDHMSGNPVRDPQTGFAIECKENEPGEMISPIRYNNPIQRFEGYTDPDSNEKKILRNVLKKGDLYFRSGDILSCDDHGFYYFHDRSGDTFRWKGENVSTTEVEAIVGRLTNFRAAVVYGVQVPNTEGKAGMITIVDPNKTLDLVALSSALRTELPSYARPVFLRTVSQIDITGTYKLQKGDLQKQGFDLSVIQDGEVYCLVDGEYVILNAHMYEEILAGKLRL